MFTRNSVGGGLRMERLAMGRMVMTSPCSNVAELAIRASSCRVTQILIVSSSSLRIKMNSTLSSSFLRIPYLRHSHSRECLPLVHCSKGDDENHESSSEGSENSRFWHHSQEDLVGHHGAGLPQSDLSDGAELNRSRRENSELRASLGELSQSLASISAALSEVSRAVQLVANSVDCGPAANRLVVSEAPPTVEMSAVPPEIVAEQESLRLPTGAEMPDITEIPEIEDPAEKQAMEQNIRAHKLAYKIQRAFFQARIEGLGKPFELAVDDFVSTCLEAHAMGIGLKELQLQLILLEGSLTGAFSIQNQRYSDDPIMSEESRVRSSWVRLVFSTLAQVKERSRPEPDASKEEREDEPSDDFVNQLVTLAFEQGYDLERLKLEQNMSGPATSGAIKTMRQSAYLVLLTLQKAMSGAV
ncbi:uncharacterized protein [Physcomitrium patens]|uniref:Uncharacterized protein n=1 Tax=Physcomitrium patens TaxID=3218 RepID=A0A2K1J8D8_PHYPA|nr:uncharacterized protein LOC112293402 [Physcomitrium patens]PNR37786.1 hypothetical protein PHYPA_020895 [Physcomitrium patens]|eukprot:XP_024398503.1 uncharacterized protein LOC112293402 [Physcomitrella patens]